MKLPFVILAFLICASCWSQNSANVQVKKTIDSLNTAMEKAFNQNDMKKVAAFYADEGEIAADNYSVKGRTNIDKYWMDLKDRGRGWKLTVIEIGGTGELVYELGKSDLTYIRGTETSTSKAVTNFVLIWKLQKDGSYKIYRDYLTKTEFKTN